MLLHSQGTLVPAQARPCTRCTRQDPLQALDQESRDQSNGAVVSYLDVSVGSDERGDKGEGRQQPVVWPDPPHATGL